ncbi:DUF833-domain-containing protein [Hysterangium stoloniferum]|nr:DUF833-domain-containing protein [Hysterangium stoloniferum]
MCVAFWTLNHPDYALILCNNRDEYLSRQTQTARWHSFDHDKFSVPKSGVKSSTSVLSGIDVIAGGTWFGINKKGKVALLTNINEPPVDVPSSRGHLCSSYLLHERDGLDTKLPKFMDELIESDMRYSGFNMLLLSPHAQTTSTPGSDKASTTVHYEFGVVSNNGAGKPIVQAPLILDTSACDGMSNASLDGHDTFTGEAHHNPWPKVAQGCELLSEIVDADYAEEELVEAIFRLLRNKDRQLRARQDFQHNIMIEAVDLGRLQYDPSTPNYFATRLATVLLVRRNGEALFIERDVWVTREDSSMELVEPTAGDEKHERRFRFQLELGTEAYE